MRSTYVLLLGNYFNALHSNTNRREPIFPKNRAGLILQKYGSELGSCNLIYKSLYITNPVPNRVLIISVILNPHNL